MLQDDTVAAISTPVGFSGIGIVRMTGPRSFDIIKKIFKPHSKRFEDYEDKKIIYGHIIDPKDGKIVDEVLVSKMIAPNTYTREDIVEVNCHGGVIPVKAILSLLIENGAKPAGPGEFTKRAFLNGRIDLTQAEAVIDIINSKTDKSLDISIRQLEGHVSKKIKDIQNILIEMLSHIEASIDYPEYDIEEISNNLIRHNTIKAIDMVEELIYNSENGRLIREGVETAIIGKPNVGKSSLLNVFLGEARAIVTEIPGTTRDTIEEYISIEGIPIKIIDTAGIRKTENEIEKIGIEKTVEVLNRCDLILVLIDASRELDQEDKSLLDITRNRKSIIVLNKVDKKKVVDVDFISKEYGREAVEISATERIGIDLLKKTVYDTVVSHQFDLESFEIVTNLRHVNSLKECLNSLNNVVDVIDTSMPIELVSTDLREALNHLGEITGDTVSEDLIDRIFSNFCIGK